jgi:hypothetical protein
MNEGWKEDDEGRMKWKGWEGRRCRKNDAEKMVKEGRMVKEGFPPFARTQQMMEERK